MAVKNYSRGKLLGVYQDAKGTIPFTDHLIKYSSSGEIIKKGKVSTKLIRIWYRDFTLCFYNWIWEKNI